MLTDSVLNMHAVDRVFHKYCHFIYLCEHQSKYKKKTEIRLVMVEGFFLVFLFEKWDLWNSGFPCAVYWEIMKLEE